MEGHGPDAGTRARILQEGISGNRGSYRNRYIVQASQIQRKSVTVSAEKRHGFSGETSRIQRRGVTNSAERERFEKASQFQRKPL